ncbi:YybH family protein [Novosphingobium mangrovi (ex Huang et al. 2023)]|uniref:Nuclear transport factor 2 family protein n=1 Tax=Novosphingobium mangrovi (ex Huang et al. 2023) TaxID=2976432 RepID=A0ABT2I607_9SPHN|nr:nuclear transport factor 2 family protein [Novosphingobium mangrovi (ex Huang et al. 2023)]MCT2400238.1 nuclear transport factor 2 family protein [Novosphingobium mangrovi (ex Huang et al. 2023)]
MRRFTPEQLVLAYELEQLLYDFAAELDHNDSRNIDRFYTEDATFVAGPNRITPRDAIVKFYETRNENVAKYQKDGARTGRHTFLNVRVELIDDDNAYIHFTNVNYAAEGAAPASGLKGPSMIADCRMTCRRQPDGDWLFSEFAPKSALIGEDDFMKLMLSLQSN